MGNISNFHMIATYDENVLLRLINGAKYVQATDIFRVTSENPYIYWEGIDNLINSHIIGNFDFSYYTGLPLGSSFEIISVKSLEKSHELGTKKHRSEYCSLYINEHEEDFRINRVYSNVAGGEDIRLTIDTPQDLLLARIIYENLGTKNKSIPLKKIIQFFKKYPKLKTINSGIKMRYQVWK